MLVNKIESLISGWELIIRRSVDGVVELTDVEDSSGFIKVCHNVDEHISGQEPSTSVGEVNKDHVSFVFEVMLFF